MNSDYEYILNAIYSETFQFLACSEIHPLRIILE